MKGVLDRFEGEFAVILIDEIKEEIKIPKTELPKASVVGTWFHLIRGDDGNYQIQSIDIVATEEKSSANALLLEKLRKGKTTSRFKRRDD